MGFLEGPLSIKFRNALGNYCPECKEELRKTKAGRKQLRWLTFKTFLLCAALILAVAGFFAALILILTFYVL